MPLFVPELNLTHGQALWALNRGRAPDRTMIDQLRHLRRLGVPFEEGEGQGHGNRVRYDFDHLVATGVAIFALRNRMPPRELAQMFVSGRSQLRSACRKAWKELPENALLQDWLKSRGKAGAVRGDEIYLRLHDRYSDKSGQFDFLRPSDLADLVKTGIIVERFDDDQFRPVLALKNFMLELIHWALQAPDIKPGPK